MCARLLVTCVSNGLNYDMWQDAITNHVGYVREHLLVKNMMYALEGHDPIYIVKATRLAREFCAQSIHCSHDVVSV